MILQVYWLKRRIVNGLGSYVGNAPSFMDPIEIEKSFNFHDIAFGSLNDKVALVTGGNSGLGFWTSYYLAMKGATVVLGCRNEKKCISAVNKINLNVTKFGSIGKAIPMVVDTSSLASVESFTNLFRKSFSKLDIFVQNAGIGAPRSPGFLTIDGIEEVFAANHLGHFKMLLDLEELILKAEGSGPVKIVTISSQAHYSAIGEGITLNLHELNNLRKRANEMGYMSSTPVEYLQTKLANILFIKSLAHRYKNKNIFPNSCHPGLVNTGIFDVLKEEIHNQCYHLPFVGPFLTNFWTNVFNSYITLSAWTQEDGTRTQFYLSASPEIHQKNISGRYFHPIGTEVKPSLKALNTTLRDLLWDFSLQLLQERGYNKQHQ